MRTLGTTIGISGLITAVVSTIVLASVASAGGPSTQWTRQFGTSGDEIIFAAATDRARAVYVVGRTQGTLPGKSSLGDDDAFIRKISPHGKTLWTRQFGSSQSDAASGVAVSPKGVVVAGSTRGTFPRQTAKGSNDAFVRVYRQ